MKKNRFICFLLALLMAAPAVLSGCGEEETKMNETTPVQNEVPSTTETETETETFSPDMVDELPADLYFDDDDYVMYTCWGWGALCLADNMIGEALNDAKYDMKIKTEERLGVKITEECQLSGVDGIKLLQQEVTSGSDRIDSTNVWMHEAIGLATTNHFLPMSKLQYLDFSKKYWNDHIAKLLAIGDIDYLSLSSYQLFSFMNTGCMFMNMAVAEDYDLEAPFEDVFNGTWTFDDLRAYGEIANRDLDNDGKLTIVDSVTIGGFDLMQAALDVLIGADFRMVEKDEDNMPYFNFQGNEKFVDLITMAHELFYDPKNHVLDISDLGSMFMDDRTLIGIGHIDNIRTLREMESDYVVLPIPKGDESQESYHSRSYDTLVSAALTTTSNPDLSSAVMEAMSAYAYQYVVPAYVETSLQKKYTRDPDSVKCIQIAFDTRTIEICESVNFDLFSDTSIWRMAADPNLNVSSWMATVKKAGERSLKKIIKNVENMNEQ